jgi:5-methylcytosine-specific restriction endonuclease McrA
MDEILCNKCNTFKSLKEFYKSNHSSQPKGYITPCKKCIKQQQKSQYTGEYHKNRLEKLTQEQKEIRKQQLTQNARKRRNDPKVRLKEAIRTRIYNNIRNNKNYTTIEYLGCSINEYKQYLENQFTPEMNWDNWGSYWEIDHIIPISKGGSFHYTNTQPLWKTENRKKSNKLF